MLVRVPRSLGSLLGPASAVMVVAVLAGCGGDPVGAPARRDVYGILHGDARTGCVWLVPGGPGSPGAPFELAFPASVTARFTPTLVVDAPTGQFRDGDTITAQILGPASASPDCPLPSHDRVRVGEPREWRGIKTYPPGSS